MYPEILLIEAAVRDPSSLTSGAQYLPGYDGQLHLGMLFWALLRLTLALYLLASALAAYDRRALSAIEIIIRLGLAALIMFKVVEINAVAFVAGIALLWFHFISAKPAADSMEEKS